MFSPVENKKHFFIYKSFRFISESEKYLMKLSINLKSFVLVFLLLLSCAPAGAQDRKAKLQFFSVADGLPSNHLYKIIQDKKGFLWIATENGISRFDGQKFKNYAVKDGLTDNDVIDLFLDKAGNIWFVPFAGSPFFFDIEQESFITQRTLPVLANIKSSQFLSGYGLKDGGVCFYEKENGFLLKDGKLKIRNIKTEARLNAAIFYSVSGSSELIISDSLKIYELKNASIVHQRKLDNQYILRSGISLFDNTLVLNNNKNQLVLLQIENARVIGTPKISSFGKLHVSTSLVGNQLAVAASDKRIYFLNKTTLEAENNIFTDANNTSSFEDADKNLWVATSDKGLIKITYPLIADKTLPQNIDKDIRTIMVDKSGLYAANDRGDVLIEQSKKWQVFPKPISSFSSHYIRGMARARGMTYVGGNAFFKSAPDGSQLAVLNKGKSFGGIKGIVNSGDTAVILATSTNLYKFDIQKKLFSNLVHARSTCITIDSTGKLYSGSNTGMRMFNVIDSITSQIKDKAEHVNFVKLTTTADGLVWAGTSNDTLYLYRDGKIIQRLSFPEYASGSLCRGLASNKIGVLWYATDKVIIKIDYKLASDKISYATTYFGNDEGLDNAVVNGIYIFGDTLYIATGRGIKTLNANAAPQIMELKTYLTGVYINSGLTKYTDRLVLENSKPFIQLIYNVVDYSGMPARLEYKINKAGWQSLNGNTVTLSGLAPGKYEIQVRALKRDNTASSFISTFSLQVQAPFWQKTWFYLLCSVLFLGGIFSVIIFRNWRKQKRLAIQSKIIEQQREKITADLHDDIGASLSSVQINSSIAARLIDSDVKQTKNILEKLEKQSENLSERMSDFIWSMKSTESEFLPLNIRIANYAAEILEAQEIIFKLSVKDNADKFIKDFDLRRNLLLIAKEAINNAAKYSQAKKVEVEMYISDHKFFIEVCDDGVGIVNNAVMGNGIANMRRRAEELSGEFSISNNIPNGTKIKVALPIV